VWKGDKMRITCRYCKEENDVAPYFHNPRIFREDNPQFCITTHLAIVEGLMVCPSCGEILREVYKTEITPQDITNLALRREIM
jgi:hypothetical protein